jgi:hypothetical protein
VPAVTGGTSDPAPSSDTVFTLARLIWPAQEALNSEKAAESKGALQMVIHYHFAPGSKWAIRLQPGQDVPITVNTRLARRRARLALQAPLNRWWLKDARRRDFPAAVEQLRPLAAAADGTQIASRSVHGRWLAGTDRCGPSTRRTHRVRTTGMGRVGMLSVQSRVLGDALVGRSWPNKLDRRI